MSTDKQVWLVIDEKQEDYSKRFQIFESNQKALDHAKQSGFIQMGQISSTPGVASVCSFGKNKSVWIMCVELQ